MSTTITANVSRMFASVEPWDCSNSVANLGENAGKLTWDNALRVASKHADWLITPIEEACEGMRGWARDTGAWDRAAIAAWSDVECMALFVQNIASELREHLDADNRELHDSCALYEQTDWSEAPIYPVGSYFVTGPKAPWGDVHVDYYTGC